MYKIILLALITLSLTACETETQEVSDDFKLEKGLEDCRMYTLDGSSGVRVYVLRCPNSSTVTRWQAGKVVMNSSTVEGL